MTTPRVVYARHVRGLQVGRDNLQLNHFEYKVEQCDVDLGAVLRRHAVQRQLRLLVADPGNASLRRDADAALRRRKFFRTVSRNHVTHQTTTTVQDNRPDDAFETFLFVQDSQGVQIADRSRQENFFFYVIAPTLDASDLLRTDAELRASIIEQVCSASTLIGGSDLPQRLSDALEHAIYTLPDLRTSGTMVDLRKHPRVDISNEDGVSIGVRGRQRNDVSARVAVPNNVVADVEKATAAHRDSVMPALARSIVTALRNASPSDDEYQEMITALKRAFPEIRVIRDLRWNAVQDLRKLEKALLCAGAADLTKVHKALKNLRTAHPACPRRRAGSPTPPVPTPSAAPVPPPPPARFTSRFAEPDPASCRTQRRNPHPSDRVRTAALNVTAQDPSASTSSKAVENRPGREPVAGTTCPARTVRARTTVDRLAPEAVEMTRPVGAGPTVNATPNLHMAPTVVTASTLHTVPTTETGGLSREEVNTDGPGELTSTAAARSHAPFEPAAPAVDQPPDEFRSPDRIDPIYATAATGQGTTDARSPQPDAKTAGRLTTEGFLKDWKPASPAVNRAPIHLPPIDEHTASVTEQRWVTFPPDIMAPDHPYVADPDDAIFEAPEIAHDHTASVTEQRWVTFPPDIMAPDHPYVADPDDAIFEAPEIARDHTASVTEQRWVTFPPDIMAPDHPYVADPDDAIFEAPEIAHDHTASVTEQRWVTFPPDIMAPDHPYVADPDDAIFEAPEIAPPSPHQLPRIGGM